MKTIIALCALVAVVVARPGEFYDTKYENFNAHELVDNIRLLKSYGNCFLDKGPCTPEGTDFKKVLPEAVQTTCAKCTPKQRELVRVVIKGFQSKLPEVWTDLVEKTDPKHEYTESFNKFLNDSN